MKKKIPFIIVTIILSMILFAQSCLSDTKVNSILGLYDRVESVASDNGGNLDVDGYNEAVTAAFYKAVYNKNATELSDEEIEKEFSHIFENQNGRFVTRTVASVMEDTSIDREVRNQFDHNFYGEISTLAAIKSKGFYVSQNNKKYYDVAYSASNMHVHGCGPISLAMALNMLSGKSVYDAETLALWSKNNGYMDSSSGTVWAFMNDYASAQGFNVEETALGVSDMQKRFADGAVIVTCMGKGTFTDSGHFIVLAGLDSEENVQVVDPISIYRTNKNWNIDQILKESKGTFWVIKR